MTSWKQLPSHLTHVVTQIARKGTALHTHPTINACRQCLTCDSQATAICCVVTQHKEDYTMHPSLWEGRAPIYGVGRGGIEPAQASPNPLTP